MDTRRPSHDYDPFEPGHATPEFERYARENYATRSRGRNEDRPLRSGSGDTQDFPGGHPEPSSVEPPQQKGKPRSGARGVLGILSVILIAALVEVFGFNFSSFSSMLYPETGSYLVDGVAPSTAEPITLSAGDNTFEITGLDAEIKSIHFTPVIENAAAAAAATDGKVQIVMYLQDQGNANYYALPAVSVDPNDASRTYISLEPAGNCHSIKVTATNLSDIGPITVTGIALNDRVPFDFDLFRFLSTLVVLLALYALRPHASLYSRVMDLGIFSHKALVVGLVALQVAIIFLLVSGNTHFVSMTQTASTENYYQYQKLAVALTQGHFYLNDVPSDALASMANPYDTSARASLGVPYLWDHAYFQGRYYVYFGILPCLVFYVPWLIVTGTGFPTWLGVALCDAAFAAGATYLLYQVCRRWFPRTSLGAFVVLDIMLFVAGGALILARTPSMYFLPEAMGLALVVWGLGLWVGGTSQGVIERGKVTLGAVLVALTLATRPQMVLAAVFGLLLLWPFLKGSRSHAAARGEALSAFRMALVPFFVVGVAVLAYNFLRFGSPFDFGANYNLTTNDMVHRGFHADRIPFGLYAYLFQPPVLGSQFPFLQKAYLDPAYQGITIYEPMYGGYFFLYPMTLVILALPRVKRGLQDKGLFVPLLVALGVALTLCIFDLQGAGILMRYVCDFGIYLAFAAALVFLELVQVRSSQPLGQGWTTQLGQGRARPDGMRVGSSGETVSVYRIALYFMYGSLVAMLVMAVLLWEAFGMY